MSFLALLPEFNSNSFDFLFTSAYLELDYSMDLILD
jgi:hypothetical protein